MKIALDFDGTFTLDPSFWLDFISEAEDAGHEVFIVTARDEFNDGINWSACIISRAIGKPVGMSWPPCPVIWCDGREKRKVVRERGIKIDVWIDDNPYAIVSATSFTNPAQLAEWRAQDQYRGSNLPVTGDSRGFEDAPNRSGSPQEPTNLHGRPGLFSARSRRHSERVADRERPAQSGPATSLGEGEVNGPR